jgi:uncharacterized membrane protein
VDLSGPFQVVILWAHALAAATWVGGSLFYAVALNPALAELGRTTERVSLVAAAGREFREVVRLAILIFAVTGFILAFSRLSQPRVTLAYVAVLAAKVVLSLWMFWLAGRIGLPRVVTTAGPSDQSAWWRQPQSLILLLGAVVYLLSLTLRVLYEQAIEPLP